MKNFIKNILLLVAVFILSYYAAPYFGALYDKFSPQYGNSFLGTGKDLSLFVAGLPVAYIFFIPFLFELFGFGKKIKWILWLLAPTILFLFAADKYHIYVPVVVGLIGFILAKLINLLISKIKHSNPPMVVK